MKNLGKIVLYSSIAVLTFSISACSGDAKDAEDSAEVVINEADLLVADYNIDGMVCAMGCAKTIQDGVADMSGVAACTVDFETGKAHIEFDKTQLDENEIVAVIEGMADGKYKVSKWEEKAVEAESEELETSDETEESTTEVSLPDFEIPNLFKLLFNQL